MADVTVVARFAGAEIDPEALIQQFGVTPSNIWNRGDTDRRSRTRESSGMNVPVAEAASGAEAIQAAFSWLATHHSLVAEASAQGGEIELDFGMFVGAEESFAPSLSLSVEALSQFAEAGVSVRVSAYPTSGE